jgi:hypothetical protein
MKSIFFVAVLLVVSGCASFQAPNYTLSNENTEKIGGASRKLNVIVATPSFNDGGAIKCRGAGMVHLPGNVTFSAYISDAIKKELQSANAYDPNSATSIEVRLTKTDFYSTVGNTNWYIDADYKVNGQSFSVSTVYHDRSSYDATKACNNISAYFLKAVNKHISQLFEQPAVRTALNITGKDVATAGSRLEEQTAAPAAQDIPGKDATDTESRLEKLKNLFDKGLITEEEYARERKRVLESM